VQPQLQLIAGERRDVDVLDQFDLFQRRKQSCIVAKIANTCDIY